MVIFELRRGGPSRYLSVRALYEKDGMSAPEPVKELVAEYCAGKRSEEPIVLLVGGERLEMEGAAEECTAEALKGPFTLPCLLRQVRAPRPDGKPP
jgi:hypothetical protein